MGYLRSSLPLSLMNLMSYLSVHARPLNYVRLFLLHRDADGILERFVDYSDKEFMSFVVKNQNNDMIIEILLLFYYCYYIFLLK